MNCKLPIAYCLLLLAALPAAAQEKKISLSHPCEEGIEFTIFVPFKLPPNATLVRYEWFRDGVSASDSIETIVNGSAIRYVVPADSAYGKDTVEFYFSYWLDDDCDVWVNSPIYKVAFWPDGDCRLTSGSVVAPEVVLSACKLVGGSVVAPVANACNLVGGIVGKKKKKEQ
jgi:hypothetical protein